MNAVQLSTVFQLIALAAFVWAALGPFAEPERNHKRAQFIAAGLACLMAAWLLGLGLFR